MLKEINFSNIDEFKQVNKYFLSSDLFLEFAGYLIINSLFCTSFSKKKP
jgi:hypothetical protein